MKPILTTILILVASVAFLSLADAGQQRDGIDWQESKAHEKVIWVMGWMDGLNTGTAYAAGPNQLLEKFKGMQVPEIVQGMDQLYGADYRNLSIPMGVAALVVAEYARTGINRREVLERIEGFRQTSSDH